MATDGASLRTKNQAELVFELLSFKAKIRGVLNWFKCYGNLLCRNEVYNFFTNKGHLFDTNKNLR